MALLNENSSVQFDGPTGQAVFAINFQFLENTHIRAIRTSAAGVDSTLTEGTHYTLVNNGAGGTLTLVTPLAADELLTVTRALPVTQPARYVNQDAFPAESHEAALDRVTMICQQLNHELARAVRFTDSSPAQDRISINSAPVTVWGYNGDGDFVLRDPEALGEFLNLAGTVVGNNVIATWAVAGDRPSKVPDYLGQLGVERSTSSVWIATGLSAGNWTLFAIQDDTMAADSQLRPPTQKSVKEYVSTALGAFQTQLTALSALIGSNGLVEVPVGTILQWFSTSLPADGTWIFCHGQTLSRNEYPDLFGHWGTTFGAGDGVTTFKAADLRGMFLRGLDVGRGVDADRVIGSDQADGIATHQHSYIPAQSNYTETTNSGSQRAVYSPDVATTNSGANLGGIHETRPKNVACNYIVKATSLGGFSGGFSKWKNSVLAASAVNMAATYANGAAGVGATLTATSNGALVVDGKTIPLGARVLIKSQTTRTQNGIYVCTATGSASAAWVLTRATDFDMVAKVAHAVCGVEEGTVNANDLFVCTTNTAAGTFVFGTSNIDFDVIYHGTQGIVGKGPVTCATTANVTIASLTAGAVVDGVTLVEGDRVLVKDQTTASENGIYDILASPTAPTRALGFDDWTEIPGSTTYVAGGVMNAGSAWLCTVPNQGLPASRFIGTDPVSFTRISGFGPRLNAKTANYTLALSDDGKLVTMATAGTSLWTIPTNASVPFPIGAHVSGSQTGDGVVTINASGGVTIRSIGSLIESAGKYARWEVQKIGEDEWLLSGDLV